MGNFEIPVRKFANDLTNDSPSYMLLLVYASIDFRKDDLLHVVILAPRDP